MGTKRIYERVVMTVIVLAGFCCTVGGGAVVTPVSVTPGGETDIVQSGQLSVSAGLQLDETPASDTTTTHSGQHEESYPVSTVATGTVPGNTDLSGLSSSSNTSTVFTERKKVAIDDYYALELGAPALTATLASSKAPAKTLVEIVRTTELSIDIVNIQEGTTLTLDHLRQDGDLSVITNTGTDTTYVLFRVTRTTLGTTGTGDELPTLETTVKIDDGAAVKRETVIAPRQIEFAQTGQLRADPQQTITGKTSVAPGTNLTVVTKSEDGTPFQVTDQAQVSKSGQFEATLNLNKSTEGTTFSISIVNESFEQAPSVTGVIDSSSSASVEVGTTPAGSSQGIVVSRANLSDGGFLAIYNASFLSNSSASRDSYLQGHSSYLEAGPSENIAVNYSPDAVGNQTIVVVAHHDSNENRKFDIKNSSLDTPYIGPDGGAEMDVTQVSVETSGSAGSPQFVTIINGSAVSADGGTNATGGGTNDATQQSSGAGANGDGQSGTGDNKTATSGPGFDLLVGLIGILAGLSIVMRRRQ